MEAILLTHAEVAAVLAGFASVVAAFQRPISPTQRHRFLTILFAALIQIFACLVPVWFAETDGMGPYFWSTFSAVHLGFLLLLWVIFIAMLKKTGPGAGIAINLPITIFVGVLGIAIFATLTVNIFMVSISSFSLYYSSLLGGLAIIFIVFADVAIRPD